MKININQIIKKIKTETTILIQDISSGKIIENLFLNKIINILKILTVSTRKFLIDDCFTKSSSIAYTVIMSLIPTLTVALTFYSRGKNTKTQLFQKIIELKTEYNLNLDIEPILNILTNLIDNAQAIGGIGAIVMIFSATAMLRSLEKSLNHIWDIKKQRPFFLKIIYYWSALTLGPVMLFAGTAVATKISKTFSSPSYQSSYIHQNNLYIVGENSTILKSSNSNLKFKKIINKNIDFENQIVYKYLKETNKFIKEDKTIFPIDFKKNCLNDIQFIKNEGWIIGENGTVLNTNDNGKNWNIKFLGKFNLKDIHMISSSNGFIITKNGTLLSTENGGNNWIIKNLKSKNTNFNSISFYKDHGIITGNNGTILSTTDNGKTWNFAQLSLAKRKNHFINLNKIQFIDANNIWIVGNSGVLLKSRDAGKSWKQIIFKETHYNSLYFFSTKKGYIAGDKGNIIFTNNGGKNWSSKTLYSNKINNLVYSGKKLWAIGNNGMVMQLNSKTGKWNGIDGQSFISLLINFLAPFAFIWLLFLLAYMTLPNTKVPFKYASIGAAFTASIWVTFYTSSLIILYGAEVAYTMMHPESYRNIKKIFINSKEIQIYYGIQILTYIYAKFESGKGSTSFKELLKISFEETEQVDYYTELFLKTNLILQQSDNTLVPSNNSKNITLTHLFDIMQNIGMEVPAKLKKSKFKNYIINIFTEISLKRKNVLDDKTLEDLIKNR